MRILAALILAPALALAADKSATLKAPADGTGVRQVTIWYAACLDLDGDPKTACAPGYEVKIDACAKDAVNGVEDCAKVVLLVPASNTAISNLMTAALAKWKTQKGY